MNLCIVWKLSGNKHWNYLTGSRGLGRPVLQRRIEKLQKLAAFRELRMRVTTFKEC